MTEYRFTSKDEREQQKVEAERVAREKLAAEREEATQKRQAEQTAWLEALDFIPEGAPTWTGRITARGGSAGPVESWKGVPYTKGSYPWAVTLPDRSPFKIELIARDGLTQ